jgi:hypothetical protein
LLYEVGLRLKEALPFDVEAFAAVTDDPFKLMEYPIASGVDPTLAAFSRGQRVTGPE